MSAPAAYGRKFPSQGLNLNHSCNIHYSCGNTESLNPLHLARDQTQVSTENGVAEVGFLTHCATTGNPMIIFIYLNKFQDRIHCE